jgi:hypothetical protein
MRWDNVSLSKLIKIKKELNQTELDGKIRTILSKLNKNKGKLILLVFNEKKDNIYVDREIVKGNYVQLR